MSIVQANVKAFNSQFRQLFVELRVPLKVRSITGERVHYAPHDQIGHALVVPDPLISRDVMRLEPDSIPGLMDAYRLARVDPQTAQRGRDTAGAVSLFGEWAALQRLANEASGQIGRFRNSRNAEASLRKRASAPIGVSGMNFPIKAAEALFKAGLYFAAISRPEDIRQAVSALINTSDRYKSARFYTRSALVRGLAIAVGMHEIDEDGLKALMIDTAHSWLLSTDEYVDDPTRGIRLGRGLVNATAEPEGEVAEGLRHKAAELSVDRGLYRDATDHELRKVWWMLGRQGLDGGAWGRISDALDSAAICLTELEDVDEIFPARLDDLSGMAKLIAQAA